jgi:large subunit ribosomal protein L9
MKVILTREVPNLGHAGQVKTVNDGYARNYLIPQGLAMVANPGNLKQIDSLKQAEEKRQARNKTQAQGLADRLSALNLTFKARVGEADKLYGSITAADIAEQIQAQSGLEIDKRRIDLEHSIRELGPHEVPIRLAPEVVARVKVVVEREEED